MPKTASIAVSPLALKLWEENPRFIAPPSEDTQPAIREHLLKTSKVAELAQMIIDYDGIMPGERAVVTPHEGGYLVLEGNRRICAFQLLLDPTLIPDSHKTLFPHATKTVIDDIEEVEVDIVASIDEAISFLAARHITSVETWPPLAKQQFVARAHKKFPKMKDLRKAVQMTERNIKEDLQDFYPLAYALNLPDWTSAEKVKLDWANLKVDRFQRLLRIRDSRKTLGISFDSNMNMQISLPKPVFDKAMRLIAEAAFISEAVDTRSNSLFDVPGLEALLNEHNKTTAGPLTEGTSKNGSATPSDNKTTKDPEPPNPIVTTPHSPPTTITQHPPKQPPTVVPTASPPAFFEQLSLTILSTDRDGSGILALAIELKEINYKKCPIAASMLMRAILEQALRYRIKKAGEWPTLLAALKHKRDPGLSDLINYLKQHTARLLPDNNAQRNVNALFGNMGLKDYLDLIVHQTDMTKTTWVAVQSIAKSGFVRLIEQLTE